MMDPKKISSYLQRAPRRAYKVKVGEEVSIELPRVPLTAETEFLELRTEIHGDDILEASAQKDESVEGRLLPRSLVRKTVKAGKTHVVVKAFDSLTQKEIPEVEPLDIEVEAT